MKASDISDEQIYEVIRGPIKYPNLGAQIWELSAALPEFPYKVIRAKCDQMIRKGRLRGCACGCRGDFQLPISPN